MTYYNPKVDDIRFVYSTNSGLLNSRAWDESTEDAARRLSAQFDRWLAEYTRQQREEAYDEGWLERSLVVDVPVWENPYEVES